MQTIVEHRPIRVITVLAVFTAAVVITALIGVLGVTGTSTEYQTLDRPGWAPPSDVFRSGVDRPVRRDRGQRLARVAARGLVT